MSERLFGIRDLRNNTSAIFDALESGDDVYLTRRGIRSARIVPVVKQSLSPVQLLLAQAAALPKRDVGTMEWLFAEKQNDITLQETHEL
jgi:antitoxin (DNA-binding transcriptional repressor) of toxin-antitoxin stability system